MHRTDDDIAQLPLSPLPRLDPVALSPALRDLLRAELSRQRNGAEVACPAGPAVAVSLGADGLGTDSLERSWLALAAHEFLTLDGTPWEEAVLAAADVGALAEIGAARLSCGAHPAIIFRTSGTKGGPTGGPTGGASGAGQPVRHPLALLWEEAATLADLVATRRRVVRLLPAHHIYGFLFTVLLPAHLGVPVVDEQVPGLPARLGPGDLVVGYPLVWTQAARFWETVPPDVWITTSTGPCPVDVLARLQAVGIARAIEVYGSTESGGVGWRDDPVAPFLPFGHLARAEDEGLTRHGRPLPLQDGLMWEAGGFRVGARLDGGVSVGGHTVRAAAVAERLRRFPGVTCASVWPVKTPGGIRLAAEVTVDDDIAEATVRRLVETLPAAERPVDLMVLRPRDRPQGGSPLI